MAGSICTDGRRAGYARPDAALAAAPGTAGASAQPNPSDDDRGFAAGGVASGELQTLERLYLKPSRYCFGRPHPMS
jgi:hypothetical protein